MGKTTISENDNFIKQFLGEMIQLFNKKSSSIAQSRVQARTDIEQIARVIQVLGTPTDWPGLNDLPDYKKIIFPRTDPSPWTAQFPADAPTAACDLAAQLVTFNPQRRLTAAQAREHPFFGGDL